MKFILSIILILFINFNLYTQVNDQIEQSFNINNLPPEKLYELKNIPEIKVPEKFKNKKYSLPGIVDNSTLPYFRDILYQTDWNCGQMAGVGYAFTYEINYVRDVSADLLSNQYPINFTWNYINGSSSRIGASYYDSWKIIKENGTPNVEDYGTVIGSTTNWMTGYDKYYNGMKNRICDMYSIKVNTEEGLNTLKLWLNNHLSDSEIGGVANFYHQQRGYDYLPYNTPEEGKRVMTSMHDEASHALTIVGYNDYIKYDYNNDGKYTNDKDINNDGKVDMRDWEIGGVICANCWGENWGNNGFIYVMYKLLAEIPEVGGVWNNAVHIINIKEPYTPKLTMKVKLKYNKRQRIKITAGVSKDTSSASPEIINEFSIFNYQGGDLSMQGETSGAIEIGLDITKLVNYVNNGYPSKFFLQIHEKDNDGTGNGEIISYSVIDYTNNENETVCPQNNVSILNDTITTLSVIKTINVTDSLKISSYYLPVGHGNELYNYQLNVKGGIPPYKWEIIKENYTEYQKNGEIPTGERVLLDIDGYNNFIGQTLPFDFPFYGKKYDKIYITTNGTIVFDSSLVFFPYPIDMEFFLSNNKVICPFTAKDLYMNSPYSPAWYYKNDSVFTIEWKLESPYFFNIYFNFFTKLYPDGKIEFHYNNISTSGLKWFGGISSGTGTNYSILSILNKWNISDTLQIEFVPPEYPLSEMEITDDGLFYGTPLYDGYSNEITFKVTDFTNASRIKTLRFTTWHVSIDETTKDNEIGLLCYPNPFQNETQIYFKVINESLIQIEIFDINGKIIKSLLNETKNSGNYHIEWNGTNNYGNKVPPGIYIIKFTNDNVTQVKKIIKI
ncbi:MAG: T9SS type A sorting domain-containing protein [Bacteroidales bacterium]|nr:T9SS type A sorting domain-containing protein [Bacteroidales bacterium]